jgi:P27 family predicted phage terminase small subunit
LKVLEGNPGKHKLNKHEPQPTVGSLRCPKDLTAAARKHWKQHADELQRCGVLTVVDETVFGMLCECYALWRAMESHVEEHGRVTTFESGYAMAVPEETIRRRAMLDYVALCKEYGLTPASRSRISVADTKKREFSEFD